MKKYISLILFTTAFMTFFSSAAYGATATINAGGAANGIVSVSVADAKGKKIKAQVEKGSNKYVYTLAKSSSNLPLQMGPGDYKITVLENISGDKYKPIASETVKAASINEKEMYKASIPMVDYSSSTKAIPAFKSAANAKKTEKDKIAAVYNKVVKDYTYDKSKAASVKGDYMPVIDDVFATKKAICYDYAATLAGSLRSMGIPTRLVMGYVPEISDYHAWNEVLIGGDWVAVDTTYDSQMAKAGKDYTMQKDKSKTKVLKIY